MKRQFVICAVMAIVVVEFSATFPASAAPSIYSQASEFPAGTVYASQNDIAQFGNFATVYDNFTLTNDMLITDVHWQGGYFLGGNTGTLTGFTLKFWNDAGGMPGSILVTDVVSGNAGETFVGTQSFGPIYDCDAHLTIPFLASANVTHWLSIVADMPMPPQWGWQSGVGGDSIFIQDYQQVPSVFHKDMAFNLSGVAVPEPARIASGMLVSVVSLGYFRRTRKWN